MALLLITNPPTSLVVSSDWTDLVNRSGKNMIGHGLSIPIFTLTEWVTGTTKPQIAEGSIIEVGGSFYQADADTALTDEGGLTNGTVHIKLVPAGGGASVVPTLTNDSIPAWDAVKGGWYDSDDKFLTFEMVKTSAVYTEKSEWTNQNKNIKTFIDGSMFLAKDLLLNGSLTVIGTIVATGLVKWKHYYKDSSITRDDVFDILKSWIPSNGNWLAVHGQYGESTARISVTSIRRTNSTTIKMVGVDVITGTVVSLDIIDGASNIVNAVDMMSNFDVFTL